MNAPVFKGNTTKRKEQDYTNKTSNAYMKKRLLLVLPLLCLFSILAQGGVNGRFTRGIGGVEGVEHKEDDVTPANDSIARDTTATTKQGLPLFLLHVGPGKTGTSTLQKVMKKKKYLLSLDNYTYIGNNKGVTNDDKVYNCHTDHNGMESNCTLYSTLTDLLDSLRIEKKQNVIGSNEYFRVAMPTKRQAWKDATTNKWDFRILITYRRVHEIIPSQYNQKYKLTRFPDGHHYFGHYYWPGGTEGDYKIPSFVDFYATDGPQYIRMHPSIQSYQLWGTDFPVFVFNMHQEGYLATNFVCQMVPGANHTCQGLTNKGHHRQLTMKRPKRLSMTLGKSSRASTITRQRWHRVLLNENESISLDYDILAVYAYEQGLIHKSFTERADIANAIRKHHLLTLKATSENDFPRKCLSQDQLNRLYKRSFQYEQWALTPERKKHQYILEKEKDLFELLDPLTEQQVLAFNKSWEVTLAKKKFCSVDVVKVLEETAWQIFFEQYSKRQIVGETN